MLWSGQAVGVIMLHVVLTVEAGDVITRDAKAVRRSLAFTMTHMLCNACTASPIIIERFSWYDVGMLNEHRLIDVHS